MWGGLPAGAGAPSTSGGTGCRSCIPFFVVSVLAGILASSALDRTRRPAGPPFLRGQRWIVPPDMVCFVSDVVED